MERGVGGMWHARFVWPQHDVGWGCRQQMDDEIRPEWEVLQWQHPRVWVQRHHLRRQQMHVAMLAVVAALHCPLAIGIEGTV